MFNYWLSSSDDQRFLTNYCVNSAKPICHTNLSAKCLLYSLVSYLSPKNQLKNFDGFSSTKTLPAPTYVHLQKTRKARSTTPWCPYCDANSITTTSPHQREVGNIGSRLRMNSSGEQHSLIFRTGLGRGPQRYRRREPNTEMRPEGGGEDGPLCWRHTHWAPLP